MIESLLSDLCFNHWLTDERISLSWQELELQPVFSHPASPDHEIQGQASDLEARAIRYLLNQES